jgi:hypothetical protein
VLLQELMHDPVVCGAMLTLFYSACNLNVPRMPLLWQRTHLPIAHTVPQALVACC